MALIDFAPPRKTEPLSRVPSKLIRQVCEDLETVRKTNGVAFDMSTWAESNGHCAVCAAGAVVLCRAPRRMLRTDDFAWQRWSVDTSTALVAIDQFRRADLHGFLDTLGAPKFLGFQCSAEHAALCDVRLSAKPTRRQIRAFITAARALASRLEELGH